MSADQTYELAELPIDQSDDTADILVPLNYNTLDQRKKLTKGREVEINTLFFSALFTILTGALSISGIMYLDNDDTGNCYNIYPACVNGILSYSFLYILFANLTVYSIKETFHCKSKVFMLSIFVLFRSKEKPDTYHFGSACFGWIMLTYFVFLVYSCVWSLDVYSELDEGCKVYYNETHANMYQWFCAYLFFSCAIFTLDLLFLCGIAIRLSLYGKI